MEALQKQKENDLKTMQDEFQRKADEYLIAFDLNASEIYQRIAKDGRAHR